VVRQGRNRLVDVTKEDHTAHVGKAADVATQLRAGESHDGVVGSQLVTLGAKLPHEGLANGKAAARLSDIGQDRKKVGANGRKKCRLPQFNPLWLLNSAAFSASAASSSSSVTAPPRAIDASKVARKEGVLDYRIDWGPGRRAYFGRDGDLLVILLTGGAKQRQDRDIGAAKEYWADYRRRKPRTK